MIVVEESKKRAPVIASTVVFEVRKPGRPSHADSDRDRYSKPGGSGCSRAGGRRTVPHWRYVPVTSSKA